jgi:kinesin family member 11
VHQETVRIVDAQLNDMALQMAALDEFVTRARSQNDRHHTAHTESLAGLSDKVHCGFTNLEGSLETTSENLSAFGTDTSTTLSSLQNALEPLTEEVHQSLERLQTDIRSAPLKDYTHTGETPQKKDWAYPTTLPQTEDQATMLATFRGLPDPKQQAITNAARTPGRSPRKMASPRKMHSPSKLPSPSKGKIYTDKIDVKNANAHAHPPGTTSTASFGGGLKEIDMNIVQPSGQRPVSADGLLPSDFSKSVGSGIQQPPLKRHATTGIEGSRLPMKLGFNKVNDKAMADGREKENHTINVLSQSVGAGGGSGRRLRSSPQQ